MSESSTSFKEGQGFGLCLKDTVQCVGSKQQMN